MAGLQFVPLLHTNNDIFSLLGRIQFRQTGNHPYRDPSAMVSIPCQSGCLQHKRSAVQTPLLALKTFYLLLTKIKQ